MIILMKKIVLSTLVFWFMFSCKNADQMESDLVGTYRLIEVLSDPGNGSGSFQPVSSSKTITFFADGTLSSNGDLCTPSLSSNAPVSGMYSLPDSTISSPNCPNVGIPIRFSLQEKILIISYPCFEPCLAKYTK
jgi:hypothetical protein